MTEPPDRIERLWTDVKRHPAIRAAAIYGGASWFLVQAIDVLGGSETVVRSVAIALVAGLVAVVASISWSTRSSGAAATARARRGLRLLSGPRWLAWTFGFVVLGSVLWFIGRPLIAATVVPGAELMVVLPFETSGPGVEDYGTGMVNLLATNLDEVGAIRTIDPATSIRRWTQAGGGAVTPDLARRIGTDLGVGSMLTGSITALGSRVRLIAQIHDLAGALLAEAQADGEGQDLLTLVDSVSLRLLREIWRSDEPIPNLRIGAITTASVPAIRSYLKGERYYRASAWDSAIAGFEDAVRRDSTFALALFRLFRAREWAQMGVEEDRALPGLADRIAANLDRLPERERSLARWWLMFERRRPGAADSARALIARYPEDAEVWNALAESLVHRSVFGYAPDSIIEVIAEVRRRDPSNTEPLYHLIQAHLFRGDSAAVARLVSGIDTSSWQRPYYELLQSVAFGPDANLGARLANLVRASEDYPDIRRTALLEDALIAFNERLFSRDNTDPDVVLPALDSLLNGLPPLNRAVLRAYVQAPLLLEVGRAEAALLMLERTDPFTRLLLMMADVSGALPSDARVPYDAVIADPAGFYHDALLRYWFTARGDTVRANRLTIAGSPEAGQDEIADYLRFEAAYRRLLVGDTIGAIEAMQSAMHQTSFGQPLRTAPYPAYSVVAEMADRPPTRSAGLRILEGYARRVGLAPMFEPICCFVIPARFALAQARLTAGDTAGAAREYGHVIRLLEGADAFHAPKREAAQRALEPLTAERRDSPAP